MLKEKPAFKPITILFKALNERTTIESNLGHFEDHEFKAIKKVLSSYISYSYWNFDWVVKNEMKKNYCAIWVIKSTSNQKTNKKWHLVPTLCQITHIQ